MFKLIALLVLTGNAHAERIVGGDDAKIEDYPYQISLELNGSHNCGGSILSGVKILTAAHCTISYTIGTLRIRAGSTVREEGGQVLYLSKKVEHPQYDPQTINNDIAVLILEKSLEFNNKVKIIAISEVEDVTVGTYGIATGWGVTETGNRATILQMLRMPRGSDASCTTSYGSFYNTTSMVCYGGIAQQDVCSSDSGGPIAINGKQVGLVSYGNGRCNGNDPSVFTKVHFFRGFVNSVN